MPFLNILGKLCILMFVLVAQGLVSTESPGQPKSKCCNILNYNHFNEIVKVSPTKYQNKNNHNVNITEQNNTSKFRAKLNENGNVKFQLVSYFSNISHYCDYQFKSQSVLKLCFEKSLIPTKIPCILPSPKPISAKVTHCVPALNASDHTVTNYEKNKHSTEWRQLCCSSFSRTIYAKAQLTSKSSCCFKCRKYNGVYDDIISINKENLTTFSCSIVNRLKTKKSQRTSIVNHKHAKRFSSNEKSHDKGIQIDGCSPNCKGGCDFKSGQCMSCSRGYQGPYCNQTCQIGFFGNECVENCPPLCLGQKCHHTSGHCFDCNPGYIGEYCNVKCIIGYYGNKCSGRCSEMCVDQICDYRTGECKSCQPGYYGPECNTLCPPETYGSKCMHICSAGCKSECDRATGVCLECLVGYIGDLCNETCSKGLYGMECAFKCPAGCYNDECNFQDGKCFNCKPMLQGSFCHENMTSWLANMTQNIVIVTGTQQLGRENPMRLVLITAIAIMFILMIFFTAIMYAIKTRPRIVQEEQSVRKSRFREDKGTGKNYPTNTRYSDSSSDDVPHTVQVTERQRPSSYISPQSHFVNNYGQIPARFIHNQGRIHVQAPIRNIETNCKHHCTEPPHDSCADGSSAHSCVYSVHSQQDKATMISHSMNSHSGVSLSNLWTTPSNNTSQTTTRNTSNMISSLSASSTMCSNECKRYNVRADPSYTILCNDSQCSMKSSDRRKSNSYPRAIENANFRSPKSPSMSHNKSSVSMNSFDQSIVKSPHCESYEMCYSSEDYSYNKSPKQSVRCYNTNVKPTHVPEEILSRENVVTLLGTNDQHAEERREKYLDKATINRESENQHSPKLCANHALVNEEMFVARSTTKCHRPHHTSSVPTSADIEDNRVQIQCQPICSMKQNITSSVPTALNRHCSSNSILNNCRKSENDVTKNTMERGGTSLPPSPRPILKFATPLDNEHEDNHRLTVKKNEETSDEAQRVDSSTVCGDDASQSVASQVYHAGSTSSTPEINNNTLTFDESNENTTPSENSTHKVCKDSFLQDKQTKTKLKPPTISPRQSTRKIQKGSSNTTRFSPSFQNKLAMFENMVSSSTQNQLSFANEHKPQHGAWQNSFPDGMRGLKRTGSFPYDMRYTECEKTPNADTITTNCFESLHTDHIKGSASRVFKAPSIETPRSESIKTTLRGASNSLNDISKIGQNSIFGSHILCPPTLTTTASHQEQPSQNIVSPLFKSKYDTDKDRHLSYVTSALDSENRSQSLENRTTSPRRTPSPQRRQRSPSLEQKPPPSPRSRTFNSSTSKQSDTELSPVQSPNGRRVVKDHTKRRSHKKGSEDNKSSPPFENLSGQGIRSPNVFEDNVSPPMNYPVSEVNVTTKQDSIASTQLTDTPMKYDYIHVLSQHSPPLQQNPQDYVIDYTLNDGAEQRCESFAPAPQEKSEPKLVPQFPLNWSQDKGQPSILSESKMSHHLQDTSASMHVPSFKHVYLNIKDSSSDASIEKDIELDPTEQRVQYKPAHFNVASDNAGLRQMCENVKKKMSPPQTNSVSYQNEPEPKFTSPPENRQLIPQYQDPQHFNEIPPQRNNTQPNNADFQGAPQYKSLPFLHQLNETFKFPSGRFPHTTNPPKHVVVSPPKDQHPLSPLKLISPQPYKKSSPDQKQAPVKFLSPPTNKPWSLSDHTPELPFHALASARSTEVFRANPNSPAHVNNINQVIQSPTYSETTVSPSCSGSMNSFIFHKGNFSQNYVKNSPTFPISKDQTNGIKPKEQVYPQSDANVVENQLMKQHQHQQPPMHFSSFETQSSEGIQQMPPTQKAQKVSFSKSHHDSSFENSPVSLIPNDVIKGQLHCETNSTFKRSQKPEAAKNKIKQSPKYRKRHEIRRERRRAQSPVYQTQTANDVVDNQSDLIKDLMTHFSKCHQSSSNENESTCELPRDTTASASSSFNHESDLQPEEYGCSDHTISLTNMSPHTTENPTNHRRVSRRDTKRGSFPIAIKISGSPVMCNECVSPSFHSTSFPESIASDLSLAASSISISQMLTNNQILSREDIEARSLQNSSLLSASNTSQSTNDRSIRKSPSHSFQSNSRSFTQSHILQTKSRSFQRSQSLLSSGSSPRKSPSRSGSLYRQHSPSQSTFSNCRLPRQSPSQSLKCNGKFIRKSTLNSRFHRKPTSQSTLFDKKLLHEFLNDPRASSSIFFDSSEPQSPEHGGRSRQKSALKSDPIPLKPNERFQQAFNVHRDDVTEDTTRSNTQSWVNSTQPSSSSMSIRTDLSSGILQHLNLSGTNIASSTTVGNDATSRNPNASKRQLQRLIQCQSSFDSFAPSLFSAANTEYNRHNNSTPAVANLPPPIKLIEPITTSLIDHSKTITRSRLPRSSSSASLDMSTNKQTESTKRGRPVTRAAPSPFKSSTNTLSQLNSSINSQSNSNFRFKLSSGKQTQVTSPRWKPLVVNLKMEGEGVVIPGRQKHSEMSYNFPRANIFQDTSENNSYTSATTVDMSVTGSESLSDSALPPTNHHYKNMSREKMRNRSNSAKCKVDRKKIDKSSKSSGINKGSEQHGNHNIHRVIPQRSNENANVFSKRCNKNALVIPKRSTENALVIPKRSTENANVISKRGSENALVIPKRSTENALVIPKRSTENANVFSKRSSENANVSSKRITENSTKTNSDAMGFEHRNHNIQHVLSKSSTESAHVFSKRGNDNSKKKSIRTKVLEF